MKKLKYIIPAAGIAAGIALDQLTKGWAQEVLPGNPKVVIPGLFNFIYVQNPNAAFGLFGFIPESYKIWALLALTTLLSAVLVVTLIRSPDFASRLGLSVVLVGAVGNIIDRVRHGYVIDFIDWYVGKHHWPTFNVADICVCTGVGILLLFGMRTPKKRAAEEGERSEA